MARVIDKAQLGFRGFGLGTYVHLSIDRNGREEREGEKKARASEREEEEGKKG